MPFSWSKKKLPFLKWYKMFRVICLNSGICLLSVPLWTTHGIDLLLWFLIALVRNHKSGNTSCVVIINSCGEASHGKTTASQQYTYLLPFPWIFPSSLLVACSTQNLVCFCEVSTENDCRVKLSTLQGWKVSKGEELYFSFTKYLLFSVSFSSTVFTQTDAIG